ncbi:MAG: hypothetical protein N3G78_05820 [Desulfobacterota bacterium]|nr:hypothetical protein [Thermodesulfobacteriota bacterium]
MGINGAMWMRYVNEAVPLFLLAIMGVVLYRGLKRNQGYLSEKEELFRRYLHFRGDLQVRLKVFGGDEQAYQELLRNLSESWKNFKKAYDQYLLSLSRNTKKVRRILLILTLGLLTNSGRLLIEACYFHGLDSRVLYLAFGELSHYILVVLSFLLLRSQTQPFLSLGGEPVRMDRDLLFYSNSLSELGEKERLYDEFSPLEEREEGDGQKD